MGHAPGVGALHHDPVLDEHLHQLLDVEGIPLGGAGHGVAQVVGEVGDQPQDVPDQPAAVPGAQREQVDPPVAPLSGLPRGAAVVEGGAGAAHHEDPRLPGLGDQARSQIERGVVRPVDVVEDDDHRVCGGELVRPLGEGRHALLPGRLRLQVDGQRLGAEVEPEEVADEGGPVAVEPERGDRGAGVAEAGGQLVPQDGRGVGVEDLEPEGDGVAEQGEGVAFAALAGPALHVHDLVGEEIEPGDELFEQPGLPHPGVADHGDHAWLALGGGVEGALQAMELGLPAHHGGLHSLDATGRGAERAGLGSFHDIGPHRLRLALEVERRHLLHVEDATDVTEGGVGDEDPVHRSGGLEPGGDVDGIANRHPLLLAAVAHCPDHHLAGVDAHPHGQLRTLLDVQGLIELSQRPDHVEGGEHRPLRVVFVGLSHPEHRHHRVADELLDHPAARLDRRRPQGEVAVEHGADVLGVEPLRHLGEADQVGEEGGDQLALLGHRRVESGDALPHRAHTRLDDGIAEGLPLRFQRLDGGAQPGSLVRGPGGHRVRSTM